MTDHPFPVATDGASDEGSDPAPAGPRRHGLRALKLIAFAIGALCLVFVAGFALFATHVGRLAAPAHPQSADAIIVLTGGQSRIDVALDLLRAGKGKRLLISGVNPIASREELAAATGSDSALFRCCVDIDNAALDTIGNAEESARWIEEHGYRDVIVVTNNYHMPRSLLEMRRLLDDARLTPYPVVNSRLDHGGWIGKPDAIRVLFTEYAKYLAALVRGLVPGAGRPASDGVVAVRQ